jgi:hypothetical protein
MTDDDRMIDNYELLRAEAHDLIDLATLLGPEGEGLDLSDRDYTIADTAHLKVMLSSMRTAIDMVNAALAQVWFEEDAKARFLIGDVQYWVAPNTKKQYQEGQEIPFAKWLKEQDPETIAAIVPVYALRTTPMSQEAVDTFLSKEKTNDQVRIQSRKVT